MLLDTLAISPLYSSAVKKVPLCYRVWQKALYIYKLSNNAVNEKAIILLLVGWD
jgi:hypothetical protein